MESSRACQALSEMHASLKNSSPVRSKLGRKKVFLYDQAGEGKECRNADMPVFRFFAGISADGSSPNVDSLDESIRANRDGSFFFFSALMLFSKFFISVHCPPSIDKRWSIPAFGIEKF